MAAVEPQPRGGSSAQRCSAAFAGRDGTRRRAPPRATVVTDTEGAGRVACCVEGVEGRYTLRWAGCGLC